MCGTLDYIPPGIIISSILIVYSPTLFNSLKKKDVLLFFMYVLLSSAFFREVCYWLSEGFMLFALRSITLLCFYPFFASRNDSRRVPRQECWFMVLGYSLLRVPCWLSSVWSKKFIFEDFSQRLFLEMLHTNSFYLAWVIEIVLVEIGCKFKK